MSEDLDRPEFVRGAIRPVECLRAGWDLVRGDYWLLLGITFVGGLIAGLAPLGVMMGPMMCGIYICLFRRARGRPVRFEMLFDGFKHFLPSLIATLIRMAPVWAVSLPATVIIMVLYITALTRNPGQPMTADDAWTLVGAYAVYIGALLLVWFVVAVLSFFTYPLIVDRKLSGVAALKTSVRAVGANLGGVVGLLLLTGLLELAGLLACYIGLVFVLPVHYAAAAVAYRRVFPAPEPPALPAAKPGDASPGVEAGPP